MTSSDLAAWRKWMGFSQRNAAAALGVSLPTYQRLERGAKWADGAPVEVDRRTELACSAIASGVGEFAPWRMGVSEIDDRADDEPTDDSKTTDNGERVGEDPWAEGEWE